MGMVMLHSDGGALAFQTRPVDWCVHGEGEIDLRPLFKTWTRLQAPASAQVDEAAARFHCTLSDVLVVQAVQVARVRGVTTAVLGGGCFFNRILSDRTVAGLQAAGLRVLTAQTLSCGDAALALGQAWVAARQLRRDAPVNFSEDAAVCA